MQRVGFKDIEVFGNFMCKLAVEENVKVSAVLLNNDAFNLFKQLIKRNDVTLGYIDLHGDYYGYFEEYYVSVTPDLIVYVEPIYDDEWGYLDNFADVTFFEGDVSAKTLTANKDSLRLELSIGSKEEDEELNVFKPLLSDAIELRLFY